MVSEKAPDSNLFYFTYFIDPFILIFLCKVICICKFTNLVSYLDGQDPYYDLKWTVMFLQWIALILCIRHLFRALLPLLMPTTGLISYQVIKG